MTEKLERPPLRLGYSKNIVIKSLKVSDNDNGGKVNPEDTPPGELFLWKNQLNLEETIRRRDDNNYLEEEMKIRQ